MKEQAIEKINKIGRVCGRITGIVWWLGAVAIGIVILASVLALAIPDLRPDFIKTMTIEETVEKNLASENSEENLVVSKQQVAIGGFTESNFSEYEFTETGFVVYLLIGIFCVIVALIAVHYFKKLCDALGTCGSPFEEEVIRRMKHFSVVLIVFLVVSVLGKFIAGGMASGWASWKLEITFWDIAVVVVVELLIYIFKYGAVLQQESDETL